MDTGFPELTDSFLAGQDIFYVQFNDISFYVEDTDQEHLYFNILKKIFPEIKFDKIFPLHGKTNLKNHAKENLNDKSKIYIADLDFEEILGLREEIENVFYLNKYSIENYLVNKEGIYELIREKNPKLKDEDIDSIFDFSSSLELCKALLTELSCTFIIIQKYSLGKEYFKLNPARDFEISTVPPSYKNTFISNYLNETEELLKSVDGRFTLHSKQKDYTTYFRTLNNIVTNIPGKYLLNLIKYKLVITGLINQLSLESFTYKLSKESGSSEFEDLRNEIINFLK